MARTKNVTAADYSRWQQGLANNAQLDPAYYVHADPRNEGGAHPVSGGARHITGVDFVPPQTATAPREDGVANHEGINGGIVDDRVGRKTSLVRRLFLI